MKTPYCTGHRALLALAGCTAVAVLAISQVTASAATLVNRYSFSDALDSTNVVDSVGGPQWGGTLPNGGTFTGSQLQCFASSSQYVLLPPGILSNYTAVTIDTWATFGTLPVNCFLYGFGTTDAGGAGQNYIFCAPQGGRIAITPGDPGWQFEQGTGGGGDWSGQTLHVTAVFDPPDGYLALYTNGVLVSINANVTAPMTSVSNQLNYIVRSLYTGDPYPDVALDEFRIWNGALNGLEVAGCEAAGPDTVSTDPGTISSIQMSVVYNTLVQGGKETAKVTTIPSLVTFPVDITRLCTYSSGNTNILTVDSNGVITAVGLGTATITANYGAVSAQQSIQVVAPEAILAHRYSFNEAPGSTEAADSIGGQAWNGSLPNSGTFDGTQLELSAAALQYMQMPSGIISNYQAVTIEAWATFPTNLPGACFFFGFGDTDIGGAGMNYIYMQPSAGHIGITGFDPGWRGPEDQASGYGNLANKTNVQIAAVFDPPASYLAVYTNGVLVGQNTTATRWQMSEVSSVLNYVARSLYSGDAFMDVNLDEFRIYNGALNRFQVGASYQSGPNSTNLDAGTFQDFAVGSGGSTIPINQYRQMTATVDFSQATNINVLGDPALTLTSSDTNVLTVTSPGGRITAQGLGTATITGVYAYLSGTTTTYYTNVTPLIAVVEPTSTLIHRYSFTSDASDSVGSADGTLQNNAVISGGQVVLDGTNSYVSLPQGTISALTNNATFEVWFTDNSSAQWARIFDFGSVPGGAPGVFLTQWANVGTGLPRFDWVSGNINSSTAIANGVKTHFVILYDNEDHAISMYMNGVSVANATVAPGANSGLPLSNIADTNNWLGHSEYSADPYLKGSIDEFRIYDGLLSAAQIQANYAAGPDVLPVPRPTITTSVSAGNLLISWPTNGTSGFKLQSTTTLGSGWNEVPGTPPVVGENYQVSVPLTNTAQFFLLKQ